MRRLRATSAPRWGVLLGLCLGTAHAGDAPPARPRMWLALGAHGHVVLQHGSTSGWLEGFRPGDHRVGAALASLRQALEQARTVEDTTRLTPSETGGPVALVAPGDLPWRTLGWLLPLVRSHVAGHPPITLRCVPPHPVEVHLASAPPGSAAASTEPVRVRLLRLPASSGSGASTKVVIDDEHYGLPAGEGGESGATREDASTRLRAALARRTAGQDRRWAELEVADPDGVPACDVTLVALLITQVGVPIVHVVADPQRPPFGVAAPLRQDAPPGDALPPGFEPAGEPAPADAQVDGGAFALRLDRRRLRALGQTSAEEAAIERALAWLAAHQSTNGGWEAADFARWCNGTPHLETRDRGAGDPAFDVGVTGLALCAFLGAGYTSLGRHPYAQTVRRGLIYLQEVQDDEGCAGRRSVQHYVYNHAAAALALVEAYGMTGAQAYKRPAQRALDFIALARNPAAAWRYGVRPGDSDTSVSGWMGLVLHAARQVNAHAQSRGQAAPFVIDPEALPALEDWLTRVTDAGTGWVSYVKRGSGPSPEADRRVESRFSPPGALTALGVLCRIYGGADLRQDSPVRLGAVACGRRVPDPDENGEGNDTLYWFFGAQAVCRLGGDSWLRWGRALREALLPAQCKDADDGACGVHGSWDPVDTWGRRGGRVYSTAIGALILETRARVLR